MKIASPLFMALVLVGGCRDRGVRAGGEVDQAELAARETRLTESLRDSTANRADPVARWVLPNDLAEISGLALTPDGHLLAHDDERGKISLIDYRTGMITKQFLLGSRGVQADFEGIAVVGRDLFMLTSNGKIYEFHEGANDGHVEYTLNDTNLGKECEFEGLAYAQAIESLLLVCKNVREKELKDQLVVYRWEVTGQGTDRLSHVSMPLEDLLAQYNWKDLHPSGIEVDPLTGNYVIVAAQEKALVIITPEGQLVSSRELPPGHVQPEGITITRDSLLIISDEAKQQPAAITVYRWP